MASIRFSIYAIIGCVLSFGIALYIVSVLFTAGNGWEKFSRPSLSLRGAKAVRVYVKSVDLLDPCVLDDYALEVKEAWVERVVERYESIPITKRISGYRLCVSAIKTIRLPSNKENEFDLRIQIRDSLGKIQADSGSPCVSSSRYRAVFIADIEDLHNLPSSGEIVFVRIKFRNGITEKIPVASLRFAIRE